MPAYLVLLRGINVGKAKRVPMAELRTLLEGLGYERVATVLNSGNAAFRAHGKDPSALASDLTAALRQHFGFEIPVVVKSAEELDRIISSNGLASDAQDHSRLMVAFHREPISPEVLATIRERIVAPEALLVTPHAAFFYCAHGILECSALQYLLGTAGNTLTARNWSTVTKLQKLVAEREP